MTFRIFVTLLHEYVILLRVSKNSGAIIFDTHLHCFQESEMAVDKMSQCSGTSQVLVPLTSSMYVPGEIEDKDKLLVDIGAAYYAEKDCKGATKYLQRKQVKLKIE